MGTPGFTNPILMYWEPRSIEIAARAASEPGGGDDQCTEAAHHLQGDSLARGAKPPTKRRRRREGTSLFIALTLPTIIVKSGGTGRPAYKQLLKAGSNSTSPWHFGRSG